MFSENRLCGDGDTESVPPAGFDDNSAPLQIHNPIDGDRFLRAEMKEAAKKPLRQGTSAPMAGATATPTLTVTGGYSPSTRRRRSSRIVPDQ